MSKVSLLLLGGVALFLAIGCAGSAAKKSDSVPNEPTEPTVEESAAVAPANDPVERTASPPPSAGPAEDKPTDMPAAKAADTTAATVTDCDSFDGTATELAAEKGMTKADLKAAGTCAGPKGRCNANKCADPNFPNCYALKNKKFQCSR